MAPIFHMLNKKHSAQEIGKALEEVAAKNDPSALRDISIGWVAFDTSIGEIRMNYPGLEVFHRAIKADFKNDEWKTLVTVL